MPENVIVIPKKETTVPDGYELKVAAYCRVSTTHEEQQSSLENQIAYYTHYINDKPGWRLVAIYYDRGSGMRASERPGYQRMLKDCAKGKIDLILVKSVSRFGRDALEAIRRVRKLKEMRIRRRSNV